MNRSSESKRNPSREKIRFEGVSQPLDKYWYGELAVYYCNHCQKAPKVGRNQVAVPAAHDACVPKNPQRRQLEDLVYTILRNNTDADVFGDKS